MEKRDYALTIILAGVVLLTFTFTISLLVWPEKVIGIISIP